MTKTKSDPKSDLEEIRLHWQNWATTYGTDLRATTRTSTAKEVEIATLLKTVHALSASLSDKARILEMGCGNGYNLLSLYKAFPHYTYEGIDFIEEMIVSARENQREFGIGEDKLTFNTGNVLELTIPDNHFDLIFTIRCLINLNTDELQLQAIKNLAGKIKPGGHLLMLENSATSYGKQNELRHIVGLEKRTPASFNHFFADSMIAKLPSLGLQPVQTENFITLHDLVLYVLVPMINGGVTDYKHPMVEAATKLSIAMAGTGEEALGDYGQNRLYLLRKV